MILQLSLLVILAASAAAELRADPSCPTCIVVNNSCNIVSKILDLDAPFRNNIVIHKLGFLRSENTLYYSFEPRIEDVEYYKIGFVNLENPNISGVISSQELILNFGTFDVDQDNGLVYLGGSDGIFVLDTNENRLSPYSSRGNIINNIFFKNNVNFVIQEKPGIVVKKGDDFKPVLENIPVNMFVITKYDFIVFTNTFGLFIGKSDKRNTTLHRLSPNAFFRGLTIDLDDTVYAWWIDGVYKVIIDKNLQHSRVVRVATLPSIGAMTFDNENQILFTSERELFRVTPSETGCVQNYD